MPSVLYRSISLDGYIVGREDELGSPGGGVFDRSHGWSVTTEGEIVRAAGPAGELVDESTRREKAHDLCA